MSSDRRGVCRGSWLFTEYGTGMIAREPDRDGVRHWRVTVSTRRTCTGHSMIGDHPVLNRESVSGLFLVSMLKIDKLSGTEI